jgi:hypothetical protein
VNVNYGSLGKGTGTYAVVNVNTGHSVDWGSLAGTFATLQLPALSASLSWNTSQLYTAGILSVGLAGDYSNNGVVDAADYVVWRKGLGPAYSRTITTCGGHTSVKPLAAARVQPRTPYPNRPPSCLWH